MLTKLLFYLTMVFVLPAAGLGCLMAVCYYYLNWEPVALYLFAIPALFLLVFGHEAASWCFDHTWWGQRLPLRVALRVLLWFTAASMGPLYLAVLAYRVSLHLQAPDAHPRGLTNVEPSLTVPHYTSYAVAAVLVPIAWYFMTWLAWQVRQAREASYQAPRRGRTVSERGWAQEED
jgi:hypothetical protein